MDYYTGLCFSLFLTPEQKIWLERFWQKAVDSPYMDTYLGCSIEFQAKDALGGREVDVAIIYDDEGFVDLDQLTAVLYRFARRFDLKIGFQWADYAYRRATDAYGGGAVYIDPALEPPCRIVSTGQLLNKMQEVQGYFV